MAKEYQAVCVMSGGLDSTTALYRAVSKQGAENVLALSFYYGQRHKIELHFAEQTCLKLGVDWKKVDISSINSLLPGSALSDSDVDVPEGHYAEDTMKQTVVPNRNAIMANIAIGAVVGYGARTLWLGVHAGDHFIYPDCRPEFITQLEMLAKVANEGFIYPEFTIVTPYIASSKNDIAIEAWELGLPFHETWSCYNGAAISDQMKAASLRPPGEKEFGGFDIPPHCGRCSTCVERLEAIDYARNHFDEKLGEDSDFADFTEYTDDEFWLKAIEQWERENDGSN